MLLLHARMFQMPILHVAQIKKTMFFDFFSIWPISMRVTFLKAIDAYYHLVSDTSFNRSQSYGDVREPKYLETPSPALPRRSFEGPQSRLTEIVISCNEKSSLCLSYTF